MRTGQAGLLSRALVGCHPRRWRERYREEMLDVLDQHRASARTVLNLAVSVLSTHVDPAYRTEALSLPRLRRAALISVVIAAPLALILGPIGYGIWQDDHWHPAADEGLVSAAFSAHAAILVTAFGVTLDGIDMVWDVTDLAGRGACRSSRAASPRRCCRTTASWPPSTSAIRSCGTWPTPGTRPG